MNNNQKYIDDYKKQHYDRINVFVKKGLKSLAQDRAKDLEKSMSQYIQDLIMEDLEKRD